MTDHVTLFEMSARDGLQNEKGFVATDQKVKLINLLSDCGFAFIEATSFVSPKWVPQMADAAKVMEQIARKPGVSYTALTPNLQGLRAAMSSNVDEVAIFASASEGFSQKNINCSIAESFDRFAPVLEMASQHGLPVRGYVSCVADCPFDGPTDPAQVATVAARLIDLGCYQVSLGDTIGTGTPDRIDAMLSVVADQVPVAKLAGHFHDTHHHALDNIDVSLAKGIRVFDSSVAGLGGCPFAPGAQGNVATEAVVARLHEQDFQTGIDMKRLSDCVAFARTLKGVS